MKKSLRVVVLLLTFIVGCSTNDSPIAVDNEEIGSELLKFPSVKKDNSTSIQFSVSKEIKSSIGGEIPFEFTLPSGIIVEGLLTIPSNALNSDETITIIFDNDYAVADFYPSPYKFNEPLILTYYYNGINLPEIKAKDLNFYYIADTGRSELVKSKNKVVSNSNRQLGIVEAELEHFSRYGWKK